MAPGKEQLKGKGGGQECPPHTGHGYNWSVMKLRSIALLLSSILFVAVVVAQNSGSDGLPSAPSAVQQEQTAPKPAPPAPPPAASQTASPTDTASATPEPQTKPQAEDPAKPALLRPKLIPVWLRPMMPQLRSQRR